MTDQSTELLEAAKAVLPLLKASTDQYNALKKAVGMPLRDASDYLRKLAEKPDETPADSLRREADEMEAKDAAIKRFRAAVAAFG